MLTEAMIGAIAEAIIGYALEQFGVGDHIRSALGREPTKLALKKALTDAYRDTLEECPDAAGSLFDTGFLQHEGAPVLARLLWRHGQPTGAELAAAWADSLGRKDTGHEQGVQEITPVASHFLTVLKYEAKKQPELQDVFDRRAWEQTAISTQLTAEYTSALPDIRDMLRTGGLAQYQGLDYGGKSPTRGYTSDFSLSRRSGKTAISPTIDVVELQVATEGKGVRSVRALL